jgi:thymidine phosphorylase
MKEVVAACHGCLVWGGHVNLSPADDILISVERPLSLDTREQMVASIMSKKLAAGSTHLLIDLPIGPAAKVKTANEAMRLRIGRVRARRYALGRFSDFDALNPCVAACFSHMYAPDFVVPQLL